MVRVLSKAPEYPKHMFYGEIRKISIFFLLKKGALCRVMIYTSTNCVFVGWGWAVLFSHCLSVNFCFLVWEEDWYLISHVF